MAGFALVSRAPASTRVVQFHQITTSAPQQGGHRQPAWSPDATRLAVTTSIRPNPQATGVDKVEAYDLAGAIQTWPPVPANSSDPAWSPDGAQIIFQHHSNQGAGVHVITTGNHNARLVYQGPGTRPSWQPQGASFAVSNAHELRDVPINGDPTLVLPKDGRLPGRLCGGARLQRSA